MLAAARGAPTYDSVRSSRFGLTSAAVASKQMPTVNDQSSRMFTMVTALARKHHFSPSTNLNLGQDTQPF
jgi:hypothetical protein